MQVILGEEVAASKLTLFDLTKQICDAVQARAEKGLNDIYMLLVFSYHIQHLIIIITIIIIFCSDKYHGVILLPEGLIESIPEVYALLKVNPHPRPTKRKEQKEEKFAHTQPLVINMQ